MASRETLSGAMRSSSSVCVSWIAGERSLKGLTWASSLVKSPPCMSPQRRMPRWRCPAAPLRALRSGYLALVKLRQPTWRRRRSVAESCPRLTASGAFQPPSRLSPKTPTLFL